MVGFGVPVPGELDGGFDVWLPLYLVLSFVLVMNVVGWRVSVRATIASVVGGHLWWWATTPLGVIPAAAAALLVVLAATEVGRRKRLRSPPR
jgi:hypothetical protein